MKQLFICLTLIAALAGCGKTYDIDGIALDVKEHHNTSLAAGGSGVRCESVELIREGGDEYRLVGIAKYSDGREVPVRVTIDPQTNKGIIQ